MMEVASILTTNSNLEGVLKEFLMRYPPIRLDREDCDTFYFVNRIDDKYELFYHTCNDLEYEFGYNFSSDSVAFIRKYFLNQKIYLMDISFRSRDFFKQFLKDFIHYILTEHKINTMEIFIDDPFEGLMQIDGSGGVAKIELKS